MIKADGSLYIPTDWTRVNPRNGQFMKGHEPHNKGKRREEWMSKEGMKASSKGWENLDKYRCKGHPNANKARAVNVVAVRNNGEYKIFEFIADAARWINGNGVNVRRCCRLNQERHVNRKTGKINTDHQYKGVRFYFASDPIWNEKIGHNII